MLRIAFIRHGETDWNASRRFQGTSERPLNASGIAQAQALAPHLATLEYQAIFSSPQQRCRQTVELALPPDHLPHVVYDPRLAEIDLGVFEGLTLAEITARYPEEYTAWDTDREDNAHGGERASDVGARMLDWLEDVRSEYDEGRVLTFSHGAAIGSLFAQLFSGDPARWYQYFFANCGISEIGYRRGDWVLLRFNWGVAD